MNRRNFLKLALITAASVATHSLSDDNPIEWRTSFRPMYGVRQAVGQVQDSRGNYHYVGFLYKTDEDLAACMEMGNRKLERLIG